MSQRELIVLGSSAQTPTRARNHNGYLLRWDDRLLLFDPGEGTQRQLLLAGRSAAGITGICVTHFHGDHCLGLPGLIQRLSLDRAPGPVDVYFPREGEVYFERLRDASAFHETTALRAHPSDEGELAAGASSTLSARRLDHREPTLGYRLTEPDGRRILPDRLAAAGIAGPDVGRLVRDGEIRAGTRVVSLESVSEPRRGQVFAFVMDTAVCDAAVELAAGADLAVIESTFLDEDADLAQRYKHLTAGQAGRIAREAGVRRLVLTHFSQRYPEPERFAEQARFDDVVLAEDLLHVAVPTRD
jgi:ribonuclease Z